MARAAASRGLPVALLVALLIAGCGADGNPPRTPTLAVTPSATPTSTSTPAPTLAATPRVTSSPRPAAWRQVPGQAPVDGAVFLDVVWTGARFVAAASDAASRGVFLDSADGVVWHRQPSLGSVGESVKLAAGPGGVVAVSLVDGHLTSWVSPDGLAWTPNRDAFRTRTGSRSFGDVDDVVADGDGWLAVGAHEPRCYDICAPDRALVWTSTDGKSWTEIPERKALDGGWMNAVDHGPTGFVAVGESANAGAAVWTSLDGLAWALVSKDPLFVGPAGPDYGTAATGVAVTDRGTAVVGYAGLADDTMAVMTWWSPSGSAWSRADETWASDSMPTVAATPDGFLGTWSGACPGGIWASNGPSWRCDASDPPFAGFQPAAGAASETITVVVGTLDVAPDAASPAPPIGTVWYRTRT